ncbi:HEAT repeat domain-containing protein [Kitasatospora sp. NPDC101155]|uniref:HEAT repeat domain-containing protein n=1 Tax=Kitasatospora sp. NPDC101155 TaxID=3364097 RepID=UPI0037FC0EA5
MPNDPAAFLLAVRGRDAVTARHLLEAGTLADAIDKDGNTALGLAAANADTEMCELLLDNGADPNRRSRGGLTPVMLAVDAGSVGAWHTLRSRSPHLWLCDDLGRHVIDIARAWLDVDPVIELLRRLGATDSDEVAVERRPAPDEGLGSAEAIRVSTPHGWASVQTGHAAILTELEEAHGIRVPFAELMSRGLAFDDPDHVGRWFPAMALAARVDDETFNLASETLTSSSDARQRHFAAEILLMYALYNEDETAIRLEGETVELLRRRAVEEQDPTVLERVIAGLGLHHQVRSIPEILLHARHLEAEIRRAVAAALHQLVQADHTEAITALLSLAGDKNANVRRATATTLSDINADTPTIREALALLLDDTDPDVVLEAARGLGLREDPRADQPLMHAFLRIPPGEERGLSRAYDVVRQWSFERFCDVRDSLI